MSTADDKANVLENRRIFLAAVGASRDDTHVGRLSHGGDVSVFRRDSVSRQAGDRAGVRVDRLETEIAFSSDAVVSDDPDRGFLLTFADCVPLLFLDPVSGAIGAAHAGWRGTAQGIGPAVVRALQQEFGSRAADLVVAIGPSIGPCCYTVGADVIHTFEANGFPAVTRRSTAGTLLDLWSTNHRQLLEAGVSDRAIVNQRLCTSCCVDRYFSHRAEGGRTGRFASYIAALR